MMTLLPVGDSGFEGVHINGLAFRLPVFLFAIHIGVVPFSNASFMRRCVFHSVTRLSFSLVPTIVSLIVPDDAMVNVSFATALNFSRLFGSRR
ncbi:hypothetical protein [Salinicola halophyticus]|uniref:hypothetical protein n=1 Tax=Salinicola halophyticus TaxID=1808881 RepID=UPI003F4758B6